MVVSIDSGLFRLISVDESLMKILPKTRCNRKIKNPISSIVSQGM